MGWRKEKKSKVVLLQLIKTLRTEPQKKLLCGNTISISWEGKDTAHETGRLKVLMCHFIIVSNMNSAAFPGDLLSFIL